MSTAVSRQRLPKPTKPAKALTPRDVVISEDFRPGAGKPLKVDRDTGVIHRIKILGWDSRNGRRYLPEAVGQKLALYEGAKAYSNHPAKATDTRDTEDLLGIWHNPVMETDGVYANLHYLKSHPLCERLCEDAERGLGLFAASHNADGRGLEDKAGVLVITEILKVRSVDLVTDAATVTNLRENYVATKHTTLRQLIEANADRKALYAKHLLEMPDELADAPMDMPPPEPLPADTGDWKADLVAAIGKLVSSEDEADHKMAQKIMGMLKPGAAAPAEPVAEGEDEEKKDEDDKEKDKDKMEAKKPAVPAPDTITLTEAKSLCKLAGVAEEPSLLGMLEGSPRGKALSLLEWAKGKAAVAPKNGMPRSQGPGQFDTAPNEETQYRQAVQRLTGREPVSQSK